MKYKIRYNLDGIVNKSIEIEAASLAKACIKLLFDEPDALIEGVTLLVEEGESDDE